MNKQLLTEKTQESINRLLGNRGITAMTYSILDFKGISETIVPSSMILVDINHVNDKVKRWMKCEMRLDVIIANNSIDRCDDHYMIKVEVKIPRTARKFEYALENVAYLIASDYMKNNYKMISDRPIDIPDHLYDVRRMGVKSIKDKFLMFVQRIKYILYK